MSTKRSVLLVPSLAITLALVVGACGTQAEADQWQPEAEVVVLVEAQYLLSHGWGHVWRCTVREVRRGSMPDQVINLSTYGTVDEYQGLLTWPTARYPSLLIGFRRRPDLRYGPPPGFRAADGTYWETVFVSVASSAAGPQRASN